MAENMKQQHPHRQSCCPDGACASSFSPTRRELFSLAGIAVGSAAFGALPVMAGPFTNEPDPAGPIPLDKKLDPAWVHSLFQRGQPTIYSGWDQLKHIGMPIGGIAAGTVYIGGDGKLWCWDIFNDPHEGCVPKVIESAKASAMTNGSVQITVQARDGANYIDPVDDQASPWTRPGAARRRPPGTPRESRSPSGRRPSSGRWGW